MPPETTTLGSGIVLQRTSTGIVAIVDPGQPDERRIDLQDSDLTGFVADREAGQDGGHPRWVWDDTSRWYPALLEQGVRIERCTDLRLGHAILRDSPLVADGREDRPAGPEQARWSELTPVGTLQPDIGSGLFALHEQGGFLDAAAEYQRQAAAVAAASQPGLLRLLLAAESSGALAAAEMTHVGLPWRTDVHERVLADVLGPRPAPGQRPAVLEGLLRQVREAFGARLNPDSPPELLAALRAAGLPVTDTRGRSLEHLDHPGIPPLLEYKKLQRLNQANGWRWIDTWVRDGRYRPDYRPGGVVTGRWAAHGGGALSLPAQVRPAVVADDGWRLVVADVAQLEPRILAAMSGDRALASAARATDLYAGMVSGGVVPTREQAKMGILGAMYGGTRGESGRMLPRLRTHYPAALALVEQAARSGERGLIVHTLLGRGSPAPTGAWVNDGGRAEATGQPGPGDAVMAERRAWGRFTRNFVVQGTGAEWALSWLALLRNQLWQLGSGPLRARPQLCFFLHDEVVVHTPAALADSVAEVVQASAAQAGRLLFGSAPVDFPLSVSTVDCYADAS